MKPGLTTTAYAHTHHALNYMEALKMCSRRVRVNNSCHRSRSPSIFVHAIRDSMLSEGSEKTSPPARRNGGFPNASIEEFCSQGMGSSF